MTDQYGDEFFQGGGEAVASAKFTNDSGPGGRTQVGGTIVGTVVSTKQMDQIDFTTKKVIPNPKKPGENKQQLQVILDTAYRNWDKASRPITENGEENGPALEDDGKRAIYVKGWMIGAIGDAVRAAGAPGLRPGGKLAVKITELVPTDGNPYAKYVAQYQPPAAGDALFADSAPVVSTATGTPVVHQQAVPAPQAPAPQPTPAPAPPAPSDDPFGDEPPF